MESLISKAMDGTLQPQELADKSKQISAIITSLIKELDEFSYLAEIGFPENSYAKSINQLSKSAIQYLKSCDTRMYTEVMNLLTDTDL